MGFSVFVLGLLLAIGGVVGNVIRLKTVMAWNSKRTLFVGKVHKYFGWAVIMLAQVAIGSGSVLFFTGQEKDTLGWSIAGISAGLFFVLLIAQEIVHQMRLRKFVPWIIPEDGMKKNEFDKAIQDGRKLVILDEMVLDVEKFID